MGSSHNSSAAAARRQPWRILLWRGGGNQLLKAPATAGKLRLPLQSLNKFTAAGLPVFETAGLSVTAQTLDRAGATRE
jgi:hypothetical protein